MLLTVDQAGPRLIRYIAPYITPVPEERNLMFDSRRRVVPAIVASAIGGALGISNQVSAAEPAQEDVQSQISALRAKIDELEARQQAAAAAAAQQATVGSVLDDAERNSKLMDITGI